MDQSSRLAAVAAAGAAVVDGTVVEACYAEHTGVVDVAAAAVAVVLEDVVAFGHVEHFVADVGWVVVFDPFYLPIYFNL